MKSKIVIIIIVYIEFKEFTMKQVIKATNDTVMEVLAPYRVQESDIFTNQAKVDGYKAISYESNNVPICIVSDSYGVLQHDEVISKTFDDLANLGVNYEVRQVTINDTTKRNTMTTTITLPDIKMNIDGSDILGTIYVNNGTDGMTSFTREFGFYRFICQNGLRIPKQLLISEKLKHRKNIMMMNLEEGIEAIQQYVPQFSTILEKAQSVKLDQLNRENMAKLLHLAPRVFETIMNGDYIEKYKNMINEQANLNTLWGFYQVMTNYLTHEVAPRSIRTAQVMNERLYNYMSQQVA